MPTKEHVHDYQSDPDVPEGLLCSCGAGVWADGADRAYPPPSQRPENGSIVEGEESPSAETLPDHDG